MRRKKDKERSREDQEWRQQERRKRETLVQEVIKARGMVAQAQAQAAQAQMQVQSAAVAAQVVPIAEAFPVVLNHHFEIAELVSNDEEELDIYASVITEDDHRFEVKNVVSIFSGIKTVAEEQNIVYSKAKEEEFSTQDDIKSEVGALDD